MTKLEEVARALCATYGDDPDRLAPALVVTKVYGGYQGSFSGTEEPRWKAYVHQARAAIEALRTPSEGMLSAIQPGWHEIARTILWAAIDGALAEGGKDDLGR